MSNRYKTNFLLFRQLDASQFRFVPVLHAPLFLANARLALALYFPSFPRRSGMRKASRRTCSDYSCLFMIAQYQARLGRQRRAAARRNNVHPSLPARPETQSTAYDTVRYRAPGKTYTHVRKLHADYVLSSYINCFNCARLIYFLLQILSKNPKFLKLPLSYLSSLISFLYLQIFQFIFW